MNIYQARNILKFANYKIDASPKQTEELNEAIHTVIDFINKQSVMYGAPASALLNGFADMIKMNLEELRDRFHVKNAKTKEEALFEIVTNYDPEDLYFMLYSDDDDDDEDYEYEIGQPEESERFTAFPIIKHLKRDY